MGENPPYDLWKEQVERRIIRHRLTSQETLKKGKTIHVKSSFFVSFVQTVAHPSVCLMSVMRRLKKAFRSGPVLIFVQEAFLSNDRGSYETVRTHTTADTN